MKKPARKTTYKGDRFAALYIGRSAGRQNGMFVQVRFLGLTLIAATARDRFPRHQHLDYEAIFVERGKYECLLNAASIRLSAGRLLIVKPGDWHEDLRRPGLRYYGLRFALSGMLGGVHVSLFDEGVQPESQCVRTGAREFQWILDKMAVEHERSDPAAPEIQQALASYFFWLLVRRLPQGILGRAFLESSREQQFVSRLSRLFAQRVTEHLAVADMAAYMQMSRRAFTAHCGRFLGMPPARAFAQFKALYARRLLQQTEMSVKEISAHLGFENPYHFSKVFKHHCGRPPSALRV